jgi:hypothetical protein
MLNGQLMFLGACFTDEIMTSFQLKQDDDRMPMQRKRTHEDLLALGNILHGSVFDAVGLRHGHLLRTTWDVWSGTIRKSRVEGVWHVVRVSPAGCPSI